MTTLATPTPVLAATITAPAVEHADAPSEQHTWFRGWALAGAILAVVDVALAALAAVIL